MCLPVLNPEGSEDCLNTSRKTFSQTKGLVGENLADMKTDQQLRQNSFTPSEVAKILGMKTSSIYALISRGYLQANRIGTRRSISKYQLDHYLLNRGYGSQMEDGNQGNLVIR